MSAPTPGADALVTLTHLTLDWPDGTRALDDVSGSFGHGRTGLVGRNGSGKTTLLRLMAGELTTTSGAVHVAGTVATLPQQLGLDTTRTVAEALGIAPVLSAISAIEAGSLDGANFDAAEGRWGIEAEALSALAMLGLPAEPELFDRQLGALSGGEVVTVGLAALQLQRADVALLDEPTNNLDRASRERLVAAVDAWPTQRSLVVVSHDTELLEHVDRIVEVHGRELRSFDGPWSVYRAAIDAEQQAAADAVQAAEQDLRRQKRDRIEAELKLAGRQRIADRDSASKRAPRIIMKTWGMQAEKSAAKHRDIHDDRLQRAKSSLADAEARVREDRSVRIELPATRVPAGRTVLTLRPVGPDKVTAAPPSRLLRHTSGRRLRDVVVRGPERIALTGPNGAGKTTLLREVLGLPTRVEPVARLVGRIDEIGHLPQRIELDGDLTILETVRAAAPTVPPQQVRASLARFLFRGALAERRVAGLSGGERFRVALARVLLADPAPQLVVLDEPTNSLDVDSVDQLVDALSAYEGALLVVSHDEDFLGRLGLTRRWEIRDGRLGETPVPALP
ncbi:ABC-F family ATP-binding cassette domain-containing protein [Janibacter indicus]|uniref:ATPase components of ABC transporters with duplicated ATPase domains n=1 Tax=Janibacter indicus TaxID=857417 RepID=A0A1W1YP70_9MICO|nr:ABC-F family ATP-binding cassette domain-containing protein [Janibacter indicus]SMC37985.1 ATPase components of ABC transporters with duplicated ATPase domains [Janibacter indicus]